jgi:hypothetical protein
VEYRITLDKKGLYKGVKMFTTSGSVSATAWGDRDLKNVPYMPKICQNCGIPLEEYGTHMVMNHFEEGWHRVSWADNSPDYSLCNKCYSIVYN